MENFLKTRSELKKLRKSGCSVYRILLDRLQRWGCRRRWVAALGFRLTLIRACHIVLHRSRPRHDWFLVRDSDLQTELELCLSSSVELLVNRRVVRIQYDKCSGTVGVAFENSIGSRRDCQENPKLLLR